MFNKTLKINNLMQKINNTVIINTQRVFEIFITTS